MAVMKPLVLLPLALAAASCVPAEPYHRQRPPYRNGEPYYPYAPGGRAPGTETGQFDPVPDGNRPPPVDRPPSPEPPPNPPRNTGPAPINPDTAPVPEATQRPTYPEARRTANPNQVISPYAPYNVIDVEGFRSGALAKDPSNGKIFRVP